MSSIHFLIGKTLGKYEVLEHIGHGGMSEVYKGQQAQLHRMVAIKVLHPFLADDEGFVVRFQREARIVATMRHPNIVQVYDFDYNDELELYYMVMEFIDGPTLKDRLEEGPLSLEESVHIGASIADALDYAHRHSMVHRDIKPANILFISEKEPVLTDFGIARMLTLSGLTASGAMVGTPAYMAPEIGIGKAGTSSSDIYSLSVLLYQTVTGQLPFSAESPMGMVMEHINSAPPHPSHLNPEIPPALEDVILRGLAKEPEDRFGTAGEMAMALRGALGLEESSTSGRRLTPVPRSAGTVSRNLLTPPGGRKTATPAGPSQGVGLNGTTPPHEFPVQPQPAGDRVEGSSTSGDEQFAELALDEQRLVKSWVPLSHRSVEDRQAEGPDSAGASVRRVRRRSGWLRVGMLLLSLLAIGGGIWLATTGGIAPLVQGLLSAGSAGDIPEAPTPPISTLLPSTASTPTPSQAQSSSPAVIPTPTSTPVCSLRVRQDRVHIEPDQVVPPGTSLVVYITLHNSGNCPWPANSELYFASGNQLGAPEIFTVASLGPGETVQMLIPMTAPEELGTYPSVWEMRQEDGSRFGSRVPVEIIVDDVPAPAPTPTVDIALETLTPEPLALPAPTLISWEDDLDRGMWSGLAQIHATGGSGFYRYFQGEIRASNELVDGRLAFEWRRCDAVPLNLWVMSGGELLNWRGELPFPAPDECR